MLCPLEKEFIPRVLLKSTMSRSGLKAIPRATVLVSGILRQAHTYTAYGAKAPAKMGSLPAVAP